MLQSTASLLPSQPRRHAGANHGFEDVPEQIGVVKAAMPILSEGRVIGDRGAPEPKSELFSVARTS
jgi:hypothetical protein